MKLLNFCFGAKTYRKRHVWGHFSLHQVIKPIGTFWIHWIWDNTRRSLRRDHKKLLKSQTLSRVTDQDDYEADYMIKETLNDSIFCGGFLLQSPRSYIHEHVAVSISVMWSCRRSKSQGPKMRKPDEVSFCEKHVWIDRLNDTPYVSIKQWN